MISEQLQDDALVAALVERFGEAILSGTIQNGQTILYVGASSIVAVCLALRDDFGFNRISSVTALDWYPREPRFEVVYLLHALAKAERLRLKVQVGGDDPVVATVTGVWPGANWYEREVFDLFGIRFDGHPDPRRIMMPEGWEGHPLRKDFPVHGHKYDYGTETK
ncbi:MAG: NADH-quinone oxidoreductase subunit C [Bryobacter sp.]|jgi:NADH-quinone oxidoreductase subunit C|nr:NADH-quinone oxidoreductase subunit C [Bryobacter sp. CoA8 C33]